MPRRGAPILPLVLDANAGSALEKNPETFSASFESMNFTPC